MAVTRERAIDALKHSAATLGHYDEHWCAEDGGEPENQPRYIEAYGPAKNGTDVVVRMTPEQVLRFVDMIAQEID